MGGSLECPMQGNHKGVPQLRILQHRQRQQLEATHVLVSGGFICHRCSRQSDFKKKIEKERSNLCPKIHTGALTRYASPLSPRERDGTNGLTHVNESDTEVLSVLKMTCEIMTYDF